MCIFPFENPKKLVFEMQNVMHIATNAGHAAQNDGRTEQNDGRTALLKIAFCN